MSPYPTGTYARDPMAPWNAPDTDTTPGAERFAHQQVTGGDADLTAETLGDFIAVLDNKRTALLVKTDVLVGPISTIELLALMLDRRNTDQMIAAATRELASRYLADPYTRKVIESKVDEYMGVAA